MAKKYSFIAGMRFGKLVINERVKKSGKLMWRCTCDCGNSTVVDNSRLGRGTTRSCGCQKMAGFIRTRGNRRTHGKKGTPVYKCWGNMIERCYRAKHKSFKDYGGRGITVCERWRKSFEAFIADMGEPAAGMTLDRIDVNGNYEPGNCRWVPWAEQYLNRTDNHLLTAFGETKPAILWARDPRCMATRTSLYKRLANGWGHERAITEPMQKRGPRWRERQTEWEKTA
jgi:hypothetical protein